MATFEAKKQDMPPSEGYKPINFKRVPAKSYFRGRTIFAGYIAMTAGALYLYYLNRKLIHTRTVEMRSAYFAIYPMLLAERDRAYLKQLRRNREEEASLMANVEGWKVGTWYGEPIYKTEPEDKFINPSIHEFFVHADKKELNKRLELSSWL